MLDRNLITWTVTSNIMSTFELTTNAANANAAAIKYKMATVVPCLCWVGKGVAKEVPDKVVRARWVTV